MAAYGKPFGHLLDILDIKLKCHLLVQTLAVLVGHFVQLVRNFAVLVEQKLVLVTLFQQLVTLLAN